MSQNRLILPRSLIHGVLLAGGKQTRLATQGITIPKAKLLVGGRPIGDQILDTLAAAVGKVSIMAGLYADALGPEWEGGSTSIVVDSTTGTGAAVGLAAAISSSPILCVVNGDTLNKIDLDSIIAEQLRFPALGLLALTRSTVGAQNPLAFAVDAYGMIVRSFEDGCPGSPPWPGADWYGSSTGVVVLPRSLVLSTIDGEESSFCSLERNLLPRLIENRRLRAFDCGHALSIDLGVIERLELARSLWVG